MYHYYILLLDLLLHVITIFVIILCNCYYNIIMHYYTIHYYVLLQFCYYNAIASLLRIITSFIITFCYCNCYHTVITSLLRIITSSLLPIITKSFFRIFTSSLRHDYVIITSLLPMAEFPPLKQVIISLLLHIMHFPCFHYYIVITHYYYYYSLLHVTNRATCR